VSPRQPRSREVRTRVTFFLPVANPRQDLAVQRVIAYLTRQRSRRIPVTGFTHSQFPDTVFSGLWWDDRNRKWIPDPVALFIVDYLISPNNLESALSRLKKAVADAYKQFDEDQEELWIVSERVIRYM